MKTFLRLLLALCALCLCGRSSFAQFTLVSGTVTDPNGLPWACGTISATLINNNGVSATLNGVSFSGFTAPVKLGCPTDPTTSRTPGFFQMQLADNTVIKCGIATCGVQTTWQFTVNTTGIAPPQGTGPQSFTNAFTISGSSQTLGFSGVPALSSSAGSTGVPKGVIDPTNTKYAGGAKYDGHLAFDPTFTNGSNIITCPDCHFLGTDSQGRPRAVVGQPVAGGTATTDLSMETSVIITFGGLNETTILSIDSDTQIHVIGNSNTTTVGTGVLVWGDYDTPAAATTPTTANDPILAAWTDSINNCAPFVHPGGVSLWDHFEMNTFPATDCGGQNELTNIRRGFRMYGQGLNATIIVIMPNAPASDCAATGCLMSVPNPVFSDFQVFGLGNSACGAGFNGKNLWQVVGISPGVNFTLTNLLFSGFCANQSAPGTGPTGLNIGNGVTNGVSGGQITNVQIETFGATGCKLDSPGGGLSIINTVHFWCNATQFNLYVHNAILSSLDGLYGWPFGAFAQAAPNFRGNSVVVDNGSTMQSTQDGCYGMTSTGGGMCFYAVGAGTTLNVHQAVIVVPTAGDGAFSLNSGATMAVGGSFIQAPFNIFTGQIGNTCSPACEFQDLGGNQWNATNTFLTVFSGVKYFPYRSVAGVCTGTVVAASTNGFYGTGPNVTATACATTVGNGIVMDHAGTARALIATSSAGGVSAGDGVATALKNGATQALTATLGTGTLASDGTHTFSYAAGDRISCQVVSLAASTLANPTCLIDLGSQ